VDVRGVDERIGEPCVRERVARVDAQGLLEGRDRFSPVGLGLLGEVVAAAQVGLVRLATLGLVPASPVSRAESREEISREISSWTASTSVAGRV
jgi:hypothetical protein